MEKRPATPSRKPILIWLIASQVLVLASLFFWLLMAVDSGATTKAWTFVIAAWIACARKKDRLAAILTTFTFLPVLVLIVILGLSSVFYSFAI